MWHMRVNEKFRLLRVFGLVWGLRNWIDLPLSEMGKTLTRVRIEGKIKIKTIQFEIFVRYLDGAFE